MNTFSLNEGRFFVVVMNNSSILFACCSERYKMSQEQVMKESEALHKADFIEYYRRNKNLLMEGAEVNKDSSSCA